MSKHWKSAETLKMLLLQTVFFFLAIRDGFQLTWWIWIYLLLVFNGQQILYGFLSVSPAQFNRNLSVWALTKVCLGVLVTQPIQMQTSEGIQQKNLTMRQLPPGLSQPSIIKNWKMRRPGWTLRPAARWLESSTPSPSPPLDRSAVAQSTGCFSF